ncbi:uncharacterized protein LOC125666052 isoform X2 [Ostrea edulis]|uniref:uncharacterized protein LOC125666052 isoform X2 n=1 Tax=Ostrea edulis TaxID=37623 RepID=UPI0024AFEC6A|nr:uncharacterized protein LOC125666052 isoform X2 [Ostrea edulis]
MEPADRLPETYISDFHDKHAVLRMPVNPLGKTGLHVSKISFGASSLGNVFRSTNQNESLEVVREALQNGINYIDVAPWYGHGLAEEVLGKALEGIPRSAYYMATKVGRYKPEVDEMFDFSAERTLRSVDESLQRLGLDYVDIIQVHDMEFAPNLDIIINETLPALQKIKQSGKARFIGITGYPLENFKSVIERSTVKIDTILTYCRACIHDNSLQDYIPFFQERGVGVINASPIAMGLLSNRGPPEWHPARKEIKDACAKAAAFCRDHNCDISRLAMEHTLGLPGIDTTLFSTASLENLRKNMTAINSPLSTEEEMVLKNTMKTFMDPLTSHHWEGVEVDEYKRQLKGINTSETFKLG